MFGCPEHLPVFAFPGRILSSQLEPKDLSEQLKRGGAAIPAVRPGKQTAEYVTATLTRMSILGSVFLGESTDKILRGEGQGGQVWDKEGQAMQSGSVAPLVAKQVAAGASGLRVDAEHKLPCTNPYLLGSCTVFAHTCCMLLLLPPQALSPPPLPLLRA